MPALQETLGGRSRFAAALSAFLLVLFSLCITLVPIRADNDCWWHVKTGQYILANGLPSHDVFSYTAAEHEWHNHEWLTEVAMAMVWNAGESTPLGGWRAVILATSLTLTACFLVLWYLAGRLSASWWIALLVVACAVAIGRRTYHARPPVVSNLMIALLLLLLTAIHERWISRKWLWVLPPFFALWTNMHGGWMAGLVIVAAYVVQDAAAAMRTRISLPVDDAPGAVPMKTWAAVGGAVAIGTLCNPNGYELYLLPARVMKEKELVSLLGELMPPDLRYVKDVVYYLVMMFGAMIVARRVPRRAAEIGIFGFFLWQGLSHVRHLLLFSVAMVPLTARVFDEVQNLVRVMLESVMTPFLTRWRGAIAGLFFLVLASGWMAFTVRNAPEPLSYIGRNQQYFAIHDGYIRQAFPADLCDYIELVGFEGRMFNENHYAGYLIWRLSPEKHQLFTDPRFDIFGGEIWRQEYAIVNAFETDELSWRGLLDKWNVNWIISKAPLALSKRLAEPGSGWVLVADWSAVSRSGQEWQVWVRDTRANEATIARAKRMFRGGEARP